MKTHQWITIATGHTYELAVRKAAPYANSRVYSPGGALNRMSRALDAMDVSVDVPFAEMNRETGACAGIDEFVRKCARCALAETVQRPFVLRNSELVCTGCESFR